MRDAEQEKENKLTSFEISFLWSNFLGLRVVGFWLAFLLVKSNSTKS